MRLQVLLTVAVSVCCSCCQVLFAGHTVLSGVDLYDYNAQGAANVYYYKGVVYVSSEGTGGQVTTVHSVDVSDPYTLAHVSSRGLANKAYGLKAVDNRLYVASWTNYLLRVFNVSDTGVISANIWQIPTGSFPAAWKLDVSNQRAYVMASQSGGYVSGVRIIDVSDDNPPNPANQIISTIPLVDRNTGSIVVRGSYAYYTDGDYFVIANISDEVNPYTMTSIDLGQLLTGVVLRDDLAYVYCHSTDPASFYVYDVSDPTSPSWVSQYEDGGGVGGMYLLGDYAFLAGSILHTVDISNPASAQAVFNTNVPLSSDQYGPADKAWESSVTGNGHFLYIGVSENYPNVPPRPDNYTRGKVFSADAAGVLGHDPDNIGPEDWSDLSLGETFRYTRYECDEMPTAADPVWQVTEGSETWASVSNGILRINDTGTSSGNKIKWRRSLDATNSYGTTVLARAKCDSYSIGGGSIGYFGNILIEDGKYQEQFALLSDRIRADQASLEYDNGGLFDGTQWHTYRITTQGNQFNIYLDEDPTPVMTGPLSATTNRARITLGSGSSAGTQDAYFDYVHSFPNGTYNPPPAVIDDPTPDVSVKAADTAGKGSLSGIIPSSAQVHWSTDGGDTWNSSGGTTWDCEYEAAELPTDALPRWSVLEGLDATGISTSIVSGYLHLIDSSTAWGSKIKWMRSWGADPTVGTTVLARVRCTAEGGDTSSLGNILVEDGVLREQLKILTDRIVAVESGETYTLDGTQWHEYRITTKDNQFEVYVDEDPDPKLSGIMTAAAGANRIMIGSGASLGTQTIDFDYIYYTSIGDFAPDENHGGGPVNVACSGQHGDYSGVITASNIPFNQGSDTLNKVRFTLRDAVGNTGQSPIYNVRTPDLPVPDFDCDGDVDQSDFGSLQACLSGSGELYQPGCEAADLDVDTDVDQDDLDVLLSCVSGSGMPAEPGCACTD